MKATQSKRHGMCLWCRIVMTMQKQSKAKQSILATSCEHEQCYRYCVLYNNHILLCWSCFFSFVRSHFGRFICIHVFMFFCLDCSLCVCRRRRCRCCFCRLRIVAISSSGTSRSKVQTVRDLFQKYVTIYFVCMMYTRARARAHPHSVYYRHFVQFVSLSESFGQRKKKKSQTMV